MLRFVILSSCVRRIILFLFCLQLTMSCKTRALNATQVRSFQQNETLLTFEGTKWSRHIVAVNGYARSVNSGLELVRLGDDPVRPVIDSRDRLTPDGREGEEEGNRLSRMHEIDGKTHVTAGSHEVFFLGCLVQQGADATPATIQTQIQVPISPPHLRLHQSPEGEVMTTPIDISQSRWLWELLYAEDPDEILDPYKGALNYQSAAAYSTSHFRGMIAELNDSLYCTEKGLNEGLYGFFDSVAGPRGFIRIDASARSSYIR